MDIFITGANGFLGKRFVSALKKSGHKITAPSSKDCDLTKQNALLKFNNKKYDQIFHLAVWTRAGSWLAGHSGEAWLINQQINTNVLSWWKQYQPQAKLIAIGTSTSYGEKEKMIESNYMASQPADNFYTYAMAKRMLYIGLKSFHDQFRLNYLYVVPDTLYGPEYHLDDRPLHLIYELIRKVLRGKIYGEPVMFYGNGFNKREVVFVDDFVKITIRINKKIRNDIINIAPEKEYTLRQYVKLICEKIDYDFNKVKFDNSKNVGISSRCLSAKKLKKILPNIKFTPIETGISKTVDWFLKNKNTLLK